MARPLVREIAGMNWSHYFSEECVRSALAYDARPDDVFIVSYPKCGTTWLQYLVYNIYSGGVPPQDREQFWGNTPFLEMQGAPRSIERTRPGAIKTHLPFSRQPYNPQAKYLYITRNPFDCCVSYYYHTKHLPGYCFGEGTFDEFFELFVTGDLEFGDYFDHLLSWYPHRCDPNVLFLTYEELKRDTAASVAKIAAFLGDEYKGRLRQEPGLLDRILEAAALQNMKKIFNSCDFTAKDEKNATSNESHVPLAAKDLSVDELVRAPMTGEFVRKGAVGDWKEHMSTAQVQRLVERIRVKTAGSDVMDLWKDVDIPR